MKCTMPDSDFHQNDFHKPKTRTIMANGTTPDISGAINTVVETAGKLIQLQLDCMKNSLNLITDAAGPLAKPSPT